MGILFEIVCGIREDQKRLEQSVYDTWSGKPEEDGFRHFDGAATASGRKRNNEAADRAAGRTEERCE